MGLVKSLCEIIIKLVICGFLVLFESFHFSISRDFVEVDIFLLPRHKAGGCEICLAADCPDSSSIGSLVGHGHDLRLQQTLLSLVPESRLRATSAVGGLVFVCLAHCPRLVHLGEIDLWVEVGVKEYLALHLVVHTQVVDTSVLSVSELGLENSTLGTSFPWPNRMCLEQLGACESFLTPSRWNSLSLSPSLSRVYIVCLP